MSECTAAHIPGHRDIERTEALKLCKVPDRSVRVTHPDPQPTACTPCPGQVWIEGKCMIDKQQACVEIVNNIGERMAGHG